MFSKGVSRYQALMKIMPSLKYVTAAFVFVWLAIGGLISWQLNNGQSGIERDAQWHLDRYADVVSDDVNGWLSGQRQMAEKVASNESIAIFVAEKLTGAVSAPEMSGYLSQGLQERAISEGLLGYTVLSPDGEVVVSSFDQTPYLVIESLALDSAETVATYVTSEDGATHLMIETPLFPVGEIASDPQAKPIGKLVSVGLADRPVASILEVHRTRLSGRIDISTAIPTSPVKISSSRQIGSTSLYLHFSTTPQAILPSISTTGITPWSWAALILAGLASVASMGLAIRKSVEAEQVPIFEGIALSSANFITEAVEKLDPHLAGHTELIRELCQEIGQTMGLDKAGLRTLDAAASISQVGKAKIGADLLTSDRRHSPDEQAQMGKHLEHTIEFAQSTGLGEAVCKTLIDSRSAISGAAGSSYDGGGPIGLPARILAVAEVYAARIKDRSYRKAITPEIALSVLRSNADRYDPDVVSALEQVSQVAPDLETSVQTMH